ncbi:phage tail family protein [Mesobacillus jeotgali]|uniref:phage tail family protein n=1 Tax=Mesobacillus jeotgali TaxID=129985 RepID=UPI001CFCC0FE|nr:phage tail family protein [Mesobacillus jeotgali]
MRRLTYENARGETISFYLSPLLIESLTGIGEVAAEVQTQKSPYQDGDTYIDSIIQPRFIELEGSITKKDPMEIKQFRSLIIRVCNPKLGLGKITLELDGDVKEIYGGLEGVPVFPERGRRPFQPFLINWKCPDPYWKEVDETITPLSAWVGKFEFPFEFPVEFGERANRETVINQGDDATPVLIQFRGPATNPSVTNETTGESIKVNRPLQEGEVLEVNTAFGNKVVEIVSADGTRTNVFHYIDLDTQFFQLVTGENVISFASDDALVSGHVTIKYKNRYLGV